MKNTLLLLILFCSLRCIAQDYSCLKTGPSLFFVNGKGYVRAIRIDSVTVTAGITTYYPFHTVRGTYYPPSAVTAMDSLGGSWLGKRVQRSSDGSFFFDNIWGDTTIVRTQAHVGDSWIFFNDTTSRYYTATVTTQDTMTIGPTVDSIKKIRINAFSAGVPAPTDPVNNFEIILSRNNGFAKVFDLFTFPYHKPDSAYHYGFDHYLDVVSFDTVTYHQTANNSLFSLVDLYNPKFSELDDWAPGDVFERHTFEYGVPTEGLYPYSYYFDSIIDKTVTGSGVQYTYKGWKATQHLPLWMGTVLPWVNYPYDTQSTSGTFLASNNYLIDTTILPEEKRSGLSLFYYPGNTTFCTTGNLYSFQEIPPIGTFSEGAPLSRNYKMGIGLLKSHWDILGGSPPYAVDNTLLYFRRSGVSCGNYISPYPINDLAIISGITKSQFQLYPNPATDEITVFATERIEDLYIINLLGERVYTAAPNVATATISLSHLPSGFYTISANNCRRNFIKR